jgi:hypothetical protein
VARRWHLCLGRKALELREFMRVLHPSYSLRHLDVISCRYGIRGIVCCTLYIDKPRKHFGVVVEETSAAIPTKVSLDMGRRLVDFGHTADHPEGSLGIHGPAHHWCPGMTTTIGAMAKRMRQRISRDLVANCAAVTSASEFHVTCSPRMGKVVSSG